MVIHFGADHRGFKLKEYLKKLAQDQGYEAHDVGNTVVDENDDYPDFAAKVAEAVSLDPEGSRGVLACGSGAGVDIVANKFPNVRSVLAISSDHVFDTRRDDNVNVLSFAADFINPEDAAKIFKVFLETAYRNEERYERRLSKIKALEDTSHGI